MKFTLQATSQDSEREPEPEGETDLPSVVASGM